MPKFSYREVSYLASFFATTFVGVATQPSLARGLMRVFAHHPRRLGGVISTLGVSLWIFLMGLMLSTPSYALGLGPIRVKSTMGQPLEAEAEVFGTYEELRGLEVKLARGEVYEKAGVDFKHFVKDILTEFNIVNKRGILRLYSRIPFYQPQISVVVEASWTDGNLHRAYTMLINPSESLSRVARTINNGGTEAVVLPRQVTVFNEDDPLGPDRPFQDNPYQMPPSWSGSGGYRPNNFSDESFGDGGGASQYRVVRGDTLYKIARQVYRGRASVDQVMIAIQRANPSRFVSNNINLIPTGSILNIPSPQTIENYSRQSAQQSVSQQHNQWLRMRGVSGRTADRSSNIIVEPSTTIPTSDKPTQDRVQISSGTRQEIALAKQKDLEEMTIRLAELKKTMQQQTELLRTMQDSQKAVK